MILTTLIGLKWIVKKSCFSSFFHNEDNPLRTQSIQLYNLCCDNTNNLQCCILLPHKYCGTFQINKPFTTELFLFTYQHSFGGGEKGDNSVKKSWKGISLYKETFLLLPPPHAHPILWIHIKKEKKVDFRLPYLERREGKSKVMSHKWA